jgi:hypothetical protein
VFIVFVHHQCKPDMVEQAVARIDENGDRMSKLTGFLFRHRTVAKDGTMCAVRTAPEPRP